ncbi:hypothetical protein LXL04_002012 [Taraxacum kok-saghyz]
MCLRAAITVSLTLCFLSVNTFIGQVSDHILILQISPDFFIRGRIWQRHISMELFMPRSTRLIRFMELAVPVTYSGS